jgi:cytochrome P450
MQEGQALLLVALLALAAFHGRIWLRARRFGGPRLGGPAPRPWRLGSLVPIFRAGLLDFYRAEALRAKDDFLVWAGTVPHFVAVQPETVVQVLSEREDFARRAEPTRHLFGGGVLRLEGEPWKERRAALMPAFRRGALDGVAGIAREEGAALVEEWRARGAEPFSPARDVSFRMLRILGRFLFGFSFDRDRHGGRPLHGALITLSVGTVVRHLLPGWALALRGARAEQAAEAWMVELAKEVLRDGGPTPFLDALRDGMRRGVMDERTALDEIRTFLVAGHETSASALLWTLALLAEHPQVQARLHAEVAAAGPLDSAAAVGALRYTAQVLQESMRLYPPVPLSISRATRDVRVGERRIPGGTRVDVASYVIHRDPRWWPDPDRFDPDRFGEGAAPRPGTWLPFLLGGHTCMGMRFALLELPLVLAAVVSAFHVAAARPARVDLRLSLHPAGLRLALAPR